MNLVVDFGNTRIKAGVFNGAELVEKRVFDSDEELMQSVLTLLPIKNCLIASVTNNHSATFEDFSQKFHTKLFTVATKLPLKNRYKSVLTLGSDRMAAAVGSFAFYPQRNVLTIDAGTCIKYNFVNAKNEYLGGAISPGISMRLKAMHNYTDALPLVEYDAVYFNLVGRSTQESLLSGAQVAAVCEVDAMIERYQADYENLVVVITGGDGDYLCSQLKNRFFANQNILLHGLNAILSYNLEK
jgi:type III pantothenate kinase